MRAVAIPSGLVEQLRAYGLNPTDLVFYINSGCNLRCRHCYVGSELLDAAVYYPVHAIKNLLHDLPALERVTVLGGEPFFHPQLSEVAAVFGRHPCRERRLTTNLMVVDTQKLEALREAGFRLCVSLDGHTAALHDLLRGKGAFSKTTANLANVIRRGFDVEITHTITSENLGAFWDFVGLCEALGVRRLNLHRVSLRGNALVNRELHVAATDWRNLTAAIEARANSAHGKMSVRYEAGFATQAEFNALVATGAYHHHPQASFYSPEGGGRIVIFPNQRVYVSSEAFGTDSHIGDFSSGSFVFNESPQNELVASRGDGYSTTMINSEIAGDLNYPIPLSVSFRKSAWL